MLKRKRKTHRAKQNKKNKQANKIGSISRKRLIFDQQQNDQADKGKIKPEISRYFWKSLSIKAVFTLSLFVMTVNHFSYDKEKQSRENRCFCRRGVVSPYLDISNDIRNSKILTCTYPKLNRIWSNHLRKEESTFLVSSCLCYLS